MLRCFRTLCLLLFVTSAALSVSADTVTYTFGAPQFTIGQTTPLLNRAPNIGSATFRANFTSAPTAGGFLIADFQPNVLFSGQSLFDPGAALSVLTISFNTPVTQVQFNWAIIQPGRLGFTSPVGNTSQNSAAVGGDFQGGTFIFSSANPFTAFSLAAFNNAGARVEFAIDNLTVTFTPQQTPIPEPATMLLLGTGLAGVAAKARKRRKASNSEEA